MEREPADTKGGPSAARHSVGLIVALTAIAPLLAIYSYFLGVSYLYNLSYYLGFSLTSIHVPIDYTYAYSYGVFTNWSKWNVLIWLLVLGALTLVVFFDRRRPWVQTALIISLAMLFWLSPRAARSYAHDEAVRITWCPEKKVFFTFKDKASVPEDLQTRANGGDGLILVMQTTDKLIVMDRRADESNDAALNYLYVIPLSDLSSVRIRFTGVRHPEVGCK